jgi:hypothetical protein
LMLRYFGLVFGRRGIEKSGETLHNDQILEFSPAEEGISP